MRRLPGALVLVVGLVGVACENTPMQSPVLPAPVTETSPSPGPNGLTVSGVVFEHTTEGLRPLEGAGIDVSREYQSQNPKVVSDADGRYVVSGLSSLRELKVVATKTGYSQPCRTPLSASTDAVRDLHLVSNTLLSTFGIPSSVPIVQPTLTGEVFEQTPNGRQPVSNAGVIADFSGGFGWSPSAYTMTDANGRYLLCGVEDVGLGLYLEVSKRGYQYSYVSVPLATVRTFDVELHK